MNLQREWERSCYKAIGFEWVESFEEEKKEEVIVMLDFDNDEDDARQEEEDKRKVLFANKDAWMENAILIHEGLWRIIEMIERKKATYLEPRQTEDEAGLLESTILSFVATAANQIESLRQSTSSQNQDYSNLCTGIVCFLLAKVKEEVANPFSKLQNGDQDRR